MYIGANMGFIAGDCCQKVGESAGGVTSSPR